MSTLRALCILIFSLGFAWTTSAQDAGSPQFPENFASWTKEVTTCAGSSFIEAVPAEAVDSGKPDWVYFYEVDGQIIVVQTWVGTPFKSLQVLKDGRWNTYDSPSQTLVEGLTLQTKIEQGSATAAEIAACKAQTDAEITALRKRLEGLTRLSR